MSTEQRHCMECNKPLPPRKRNGPQQKFCGASCRKEFNNRRAMRGAEMYDLVMAGRFERATHAGMWRPTLTLLATHYRDKDRRERDGKQSWHTPDLLGDPRALSR